MDTTASNFTLRKNAKRAAEAMIRNGTAPAVDYVGRRRAVIKDVSKVAAAVRAMNLGSDHAEGSVGGCLDSTLDRIIEAGPASPAFELTF